ncbi:MAG: DUF6090 family protein [Kangiellaceae bacterium]|nr:DUF6090 family protein [Kangiellaceae bacterium]MCW9000827.1 DUF6090 family protein [Kangiellaceae bacterium]MCW9017850.1 DUF6090 family protein [Kangiellaceae bacterium]
MKFNKRKIIKICGEVSLIVVGILLALQIENWNEDRKEQRFTKETLGEIKSSLQADSLHLKSRISRLKDISKKLIVISESKINQELTYQEINQSFHSLASFILLELKTASYETLKNTGLNVIKDSQLRSELVNLYDFLYPRINWLVEREFNQPNQSDYRPVYNKYAVYGEEVSSKGYFQIDIQEFDKILQDPEITKAARQKYNKSLSMIDRLERVKVFVDRLILMIDKELG